jgi:transcriptional regulator with XRE-family HTH domain
MLPRQPNKGALALRDRRARLRLTQAAVGRLVHRSAAQVSLWESGKYVPRAPILALLERTLGISAALWGQTTGKKTGKRTS